MAGVIVTTGGTPTPEQQKAMDRAAAIAKSQGGQPR